MKIKFSNLGSIKETELDLQPLTVIIGPNNSNKTYIAYCVYGILQQFLSAVDEQNTKTIDAIRPVFGNYVPDSMVLMEGNKWLLKLDSNAKTLFVEALQKIFNENLSHFKDKINVFFQNHSQQLFANTTFAISPLDFEALIQDVSNLDVSNLDKDEKVKQFDDLDIKYKNGEQVGDFLSGVLFGVKRALLSKPFLLPAERNALILNYQVLNYARLRLSEETRFQLFDNNNNVKTEILGDFRYPLPIEDFLDFLARIDLQRNIKIVSTNKNEFQKLADKIERYIQNNNKTVLKSTTLGGKEIKVNVKRGLSIDLYNASSSIKQLAPLLLYLRYRAKKNDLLIIDEPEMNLHPESQAKLLEIFGMLVNLGVKVLMTTHSSYFMDHLSSLVSGKTDNPNASKKQAKALYLKDSRAFVSFENVSAYEMRDNQLHSLKDEEGDIRWDTLSDVSNELQSRYFQIYEKGKPTA